MGRTKNMLMKGTVQSVLSQLLLAFVASIVRKIVQKERKLASVFTRTEVRSTKNMINDGPFKTHVNAFVEDLVL